MPWSSISALTVKFLSCGTDFYTWNHLFAVGIHSEKTIHIPRRRLRSGRSSPPRRAENNLSEAGAVSSHSARHYPTHRDRRSSYGGSLSIQGSPRSTIFLVSHHFRTRKDEFFRNLLVGVKASHLNQFSIARVHSTAIINLSGSSNADFASQVGYLS